MLEFQHIFRVGNHQKALIVLQYIKGLFQSRKRNMERMNEVIPETDYESMQHFISNSPWSAREVMDKVAQDASTMFENCTSVGLLIDESGNGKKGTESVGVSRQYCGQTGKVDNCQVAVYGALSVQPHYALIDAELYLPKEWADDRERCKKAGVPQERMIHKTKGELALDIVKRQISLGTRFHWVGGDGFYGNDYQLGKALDELELLFVFEVHSDQNVYLQNPVISVPLKIPGKIGRMPSKLKADIKPIEVRKLINQIELSQWKKVVIRIGKKGPMRAEISVIKVYVWDHKEKRARERLLIVRKTRDKKGKEIIKYALTNAKEEQFTHQKLAVMLSERYFIERTFQDAKQELGMSEYQVRGWLAWHHHTALVMMSMMFILREKIIFNITRPLLSANDVRHVIMETYAKKANTEAEIYGQIERRHEQRRYDQAYNIFVNLPK
jgi:SRSO17 transposase